MSISAIWDRFWWSLILTVASGLIWLKFIDPVVPCVSMGLIICIAIGMLYFILGIRKMIRQKRYEEEIERKAYQELLQEMGKEALK
jgi:membrane protein YdbS with pleckstrin-like domain